jgi:hypothetical protein
MLVSYLNNWCPSLSIYHNVIASDSGKSDLQQKAIPDIVTDIFEKFLTSGKM